MQPILKPEETDQQTTTLCFTGLEYCVHYESLQSEDVLEAQSDEGLLFWGLSNDHVCSGLVPRRGWANELELLLNNLPQADKKPKDLLLPALLTVESWKVSYKLQIDEPFDPKQLLIEWDSVLISSRKYKFAQVSYRKQNFARINLGVESRKRFTS